MRLLHTQTLELSDFNDEASRPYYAILSHTWGNDEFLFSDFSKADRRSSSGWTKIEKCCEVAASQGWDYAWVDTCCIDKSSSAELTEAINSMWKWYQKSQMCYVYLADCFAQNLVRDLEKSRWFTRGWTLQELLAPERIVFYDADWKDIGSRSFLGPQISQICRIASTHLTSPAAASVATKMSWASRRQTTREEDQAYSLLGLFDINMPLIYGEGSKAFFRLQSEIIRSSTDQSIFAWKSDYCKWLETGMLAPSLSCFRESVDIVPKHFDGLPRTPYQMTNHGLQIEFGCIESSEDLTDFLIQNVQETRAGNNVGVLSGGLRLFSARVSISRYNFRRSRLWLIMLPCVRVTHDRQPIALFIELSRDGIYTRTNPDCILTFRNDVFSATIKQRCRIILFLIANATWAHDLKILSRPSRAGLRDYAFIEVGPALQQKAHDAYRLHPNQVPLNQVVVKPGFPGDWIIDIDSEGCLRLVIILDRAQGKFRVYAASAEKRPQLLSVPKTIIRAQRHKDEGAHSLSAHTLSLGSYLGPLLVTLGEIDDCTIPYDEENELLIRTRRVHKAPESDILDGFDKVLRDRMIGIAIRLDLCTKAHDNTNAELE